MFYQVFLLTAEKPIEVEGENYYIDQIGNLVIPLNHWEVSRKATFNKDTWIYITQVDKKDKDSSE